MTSATCRNSTALDPYCRCGGATWSRLGLDGHRLGPGLPGGVRRAAGRRGAGRGRWRRLRERAGRAAVRRRAAAAAGGPGAGPATRPCCCATSRCCRSTSPTSGVTELIDARRRERRRRGDVRHARDQPDAAAGGSRALPRRRPVDRIGPPDEVMTPTVLVGAVRHAGRRAARARSAWSWSGPSEDAAHAAGGRRRC